MIYLLPCGFAFWRMSHEQNHGMCSLLNSLLSLSIMHMKLSMLLHVLVVCSYLWLRGIPSHECLTVYLYIFHLMAVSQFWVIMNEAAISICLQIFIWKNVFIFLGKCLGAGFAGSHNKQISNFIPKSQTASFKKPVLLHVFTSNVWSSRLL